MELLKMFYILLNLLFVVINVSDAADDAEFQRIDPETVVIGSNVTFRWRYNRTQIPQIIEFLVLDGSVYKQLVYYGVGFQGQPTLNPQQIGKYAKNASWVGNFSKNEIAFMLIDVKEFSHQKNFSLLIQNGGTTDKYYTKDLLFISVRPEVQLRIDKTNVSVGDRVTIECKQRHQGRPKAKISWYHNDKIVPEKEETYFFRDEEIKLNDAGTYKCKAENDAGESKSEVRRITVNKKPDDKGNPSVGKSSGGLGGGAIAGIVIGILILIAIILVTVWLVLKRKSKPAKNKKTPNGNHDDPKSPMVSEPTTKDQVWL